MIGRSVWALTLLLGAAWAARAQGPVTKLELQGAGSQTSTGAFRCAPGEEGQMSLGGTDSSHSVVPLEPYAPEATSSDEKVVVAKVPEHSSYIVDVTCVGDGEAWITVMAGGVELHMPALVGKARRKATPAWTGSTAARATTTAIAAAPVAGVGTAPVASGATAQTPVVTAPSTNPAILPGSTTGIAPTTGGSLQARPGTTLEEGKHPTGVIVPDAPAVPAKGLTLFAGYDRSVILRWHPAPGAAGYRIARKDVAANTLVTVTGETVGADGQGLLTDTTYADRWLETGKTYAYYLATYYRHADGSYYFPDRASEEHGLATPRDPQTLGWLPTGWSDPVSLARVTIADGNVTVVWRKKLGAVHYQFGSVLNTRPSSAGGCFGDSHFFDWQITDTTLTKNIPDDISGGGRVNTYCVTIRAKFPDAQGAPTYGGYLLYVPVGRDCPDTPAQPCGPWHLIPTASIVFNQPGHLVRMVDEEP